MGRAKPNPAPTRHEPGDDGFRIDYAEGGARSRNRTDKPVRARDFKSPAFTSFAIRAASRRRAVGASVSRNSWQRNPLRNPAFRAPAGFPGTCPKGQIGRASCRERGCQYVEISVVAQYLKKKKIY